MWAHCVGRLERLEPLEDTPSWGSATVVLADGSAVVLDTVSFGAERPVVQVGDVVTTLGLVLAPEQPGSLPTLGGLVRLCAGRVERCSMDDGWQRDDGRK